MTVFEYCIECNEPTYNAGKGDGSLYLDDKGPYCDACYYGNLYEGYHRLKAENQRLRNGLEDILGEAMFADKCDIQMVYELAEEALQQEGGGEK